MKSFYKFMIYLVLIGMSCIAHAVGTDFTYTEGNYQFDGSGNGGAFFIQGPGTIVGNTSFTPSNGDAIIAYCPECGASATLTISRLDNAAFKLNSFLLGGFTPPADFTIQLTGFSGATQVFQSSLIPVVGLYGNGELGQVNLNMPQNVTSLVLSEQNGQSDCVCVAKFSFTDANGATVVVLDNNQVIILPPVVSGPSTIDTQASIQTAALKLRSIFNLATLTSNFSNMNTYDCSLFDSKGFCISAGGRFTTVDRPDSNSSSAVVVLGYKATPKIRVGGFLDQNLNNTTPSGIRLSNKSPLMGLYAVWNQNESGLGYQVKIANAYQNKDVNITREVIGTSEAGQGSTELSTQSYVGELSYAFNFKDKTFLRPYLALRRTIIKQDGFTETDVSAPLSFNPLEDRSTTALLGLKLKHKLATKATFTASLGLEQDLAHKVDKYTATSVDISGLTSENFNNNIKRTRPVASAGAYYDISKTQRIAGDLYFQQLPFQSTGSTTAYVNYTVGF